MASGRARRLRVRPGRALTLLAVALAAGWAFFRAYQPPPVNPAALKQKGFPKQEKGKRRRPSGLVGH